MTNDTAREFMLEDLTLPSPVGKLLRRLSKIIVQNPVGLSDSQPTRHCRGGQAEVGGSGDRCSSSK